MNPKSESERDRARRVADHQKRYGKKTRGMTAPNPEAAAILEEMRKRPSMGDPPPVPAHPAASSLFDRPAPCSWTINESQGPHFFVGIDPAEESYDNCTRTIFGIPFTREQIIDDDFWNDDPFGMKAAAEAAGVAMGQRQRAFEEAVLRATFGFDPSPTLWPFYNPTINEPPDPPAPPMDRVIDANYRILEPPAPDPIQKLLDGPTEK